MYRENIEVNRNWVCPCLGLLDIPSTQYNFLWVEGFPLFSPEEDATKPQDRLAATHHPFTAPVAEDLPLLFHSPEKVRGQHYDLVLNGTEIGGGSIRIHSPKLQTFVFEKILKVRREKTAVGPSRINWRPDISHALGL